MSFTLRAAFTKTGLLRMVAHRDLGTQIRRMCHRAELPVSYSQGFNPRPRFHFAPPLPLGVTCQRDWMDFELEEAVESRDFLARMAPQSPAGLTWVAAHPVGEGEGDLQALLQYAEWSFRPWDSDRDGPLLEKIGLAARGDRLPFQKLSKRGRPRDLDLRPMIQRVEGDARGLRVVLSAAEGNPEGAIGLFDFLRACLPDLEDHPLTRFQICRESFLRLEGGQLCDAVETPEVRAEAQA